MPQLEVVMPLAIAADIPRRCEVAAGFDNDGCFVRPLLPAPITEVEVAVLRPHKRPRFHAMPALRDFWQEIPRRARHNTPWIESGHILSSTLVVNHFVDSSAHPRRSPAPSFQTA